MQKASRIHWWAAGAAAMALVAVAACGKSSTTTSTTVANTASGSDKGKTLKLGAVFSLTGGGGVYGPQQKQAVQLAVDTINATGGVNGATVSFDVVDDGSTPTQSSQQTETLIQQNQVVALLGPTLSNSAVSAHPKANGFKTPMLAVSTTGLHIVGDCPYPCTYIFRDSLGEATAIPANIKTYVASANPKPKTGVLLYPEDDKFSVDGATIVGQTVTDPSIAIQLLATIKFSKSDADLTQFVNQAVAKHPDVIFITSLGGIPAKIMTAARQQGFTGQFLGGNGFNSAAVSKQAANFGKGAQSASAWYLGNDFPSNAEFVKAFKAKYATDPDQFAAQAYTGVLILVDAAKRAKLTYTDLAGDREKLHAALEATNIQTPLGTFQVTSPHDVHQTIWIISMDGQGGFNLVTSIKPS